MKKPDFINLLREPDKLSGKQVSDLKQVVSHFPYFTNAHVILCKALQNENHYEFDKQLKQTALLVPDREVLYYYLHQLKPFWQTEPASHTSAIVAQPPEFVDEPKPITETVTLLPELTLPMGVVMPIAETMDETAPPFINHEPISKQLLVDDDEEYIEANILTNEVDTATTEPLLVNDFSNEVHSFDEWLNLLSAKQHSITLVDTTKNAETPNDSNLSVAESNTPTIDEKEAIKAQIDEVVAKSNVNNFQSILDRFIKENPSISRPKSEFFNPINMAKQSVEEDEELVTETLANLYYKQGNLKKAIRAYEKLCLLYPSKLAYFASLVKKIKSEIKD